MKHEGRRHGLLLLLLAAACGSEQEAQGPGEAAAAGAGGGGGSSPGVTSAATGPSSASATTTATTTAATTTASTSGSGGAGGEGAGGAGAGAGPAACPAPRSRIAAGQDVTCAVSSAAEGAALRCRGGGFGDAWVQPAPVGDPAACVDHVVAGREVLCYRTIEGEGCPPPQMWCWAPGVVLSLSDGIGEVPLVLGDGYCILRDSGQHGCVNAPDPPDLSGVSPLLGAAGGARDACAWSADRVICWGETGSVRTDVPEFAACIADLKVGDGFACMTYTGFDVVDCWGELPLGIPERSFLQGPGAELAIGNGFMCARTDDGLVRCRGSDAEGGLGVPGDGTSGSAVEPAWPAEAPAALALAADGGHVAMIAADAPTLVVGWGDNQAQQVCSCGEDVIETPTDADYPAP